MFNNCNSKTNGEELFFYKIKNNIELIFDVGCREDSLFTSFSSIVHYQYCNIVCINKNSEYQPF